jgi:tetratricopeptide (TPR) repeat protein
MQKYNEAVAAYKKSIERKPDWASPHSGLASAYFGQYQYDDALSEASEALRLDPGRAVAWYWKGRICWKQAKSREAVEALQQAIKLSDSTSWVRASAQKWLDFIRSS